MFLLLYKEIKKVVVEEVSKMTDLEVDEVNVNVVDIKTKEQHRSGFSKPSRPSDRCC